MPAVRVISALQGIEVFCRDKAGIFEASIIRCKCCNKEYAPSAFEHHSGSSFRRPWKSIKDANGKSIQEYREDQERGQEAGEKGQEAVAMKTSSTEDLFVVEKIVSSRVRQGKKEYLVKWENYDQTHNSWIPPENFGGNDLIQQFEDHHKTDRKRKANDPEEQPKTKSFRRGSDASPRKPPYEESPSPSYSSPHVSASEITSSPPHSTLLMPSNDRYLHFEPLLDETSYFTSSSQSLRDLDDEIDAYLHAPSDDEEDIKPVTTITVDYEGMKGVFIGVPTFGELLEKALEYWEMNSLTSPKDWNITDEKGAIWPPHEDISNWLPEVVYLKRKPWK